MDPVPHTLIFRLGNRELTILHEATNNSIAWAMEWTATSLDVWAAREESAR
jgi:hypothetical protein